MNSPVTYTNINTDTSIKSIANLLLINEKLLPPNFPSNLFLETLEIVMRNNIFSFTDSYWLQLCGTAMGTPVACAYATITYGHFEPETPKPLPLYSTLIRPPY